MKKDGRDMLYNYKQCIEKYGSDYMLKKAIRKGEIRQIEKGIYLSGNSCTELEIIVTKYPKAIITGETAFYYHGLTDVIPDNYCLATRRTDGRIKDERIEQSFQKDEIFALGRTAMQYQNIDIAIYTPERMLIELMRFRTNYPFDYYKELIANYRKRIHQLDFWKIEEYASIFKNGSKLMEQIQLEVL